MKHCGRGEDRHAEGLSLDVKVLGQLIGPPAPDKPDAIALHTAIEKHHGAALPWCGLGRNAGCGGVDGRGGVDGKGGGPEASREENAWERGDSAVVGQ